MIQIAKSPKILFVIPILVILITRVGIEVFNLIFPLNYSWIPSFIVYYLSIELSILLCKKYLLINSKNYSLTLKPFPQMKRFVLGIIFPALLPLGFFILNVDRIPASFFVLIFIFAILNPFFEESFWRGLLSNLPASNKTTILYTAFLFGFTHYFLWGSYWFANPARIWIASSITTFIMGIFWMWFYQKEKKLAYIIISHFFVDVFNLSIAVFYGLELNTI